ncbi:pescadillo-like protein [Phytophthora cinnamomi]|uniref:pescadillo-like protein n=1 Tax=Phytophthora cinnamomi TaxID=4785 RepID=UPI0035596B1F|nr:pescadillo-like protein [Phytophthora cinnamomi]
MAEEIVPNSVGWYILEGYPWWPVYICDVTKLRPTLHLLGSGHKKILKKARDFPDDFIVVYYFGSHDFSLVGLKKGVLRPWDCAQKDQFLKGHPKHLSKKKGVMEELLEAVQEAEEYLSQPEDIRLPQHMVPSDLDPTLEPPPPELVPQEMAQDPEDDEDEDAEPMDVDDGDAPEDDEDAEGSDEDRKRRKKKEDRKKAAKDKKDKKEREKREKREKKEREKKDRKEKREREKKDKKDKKTKKTKGKDDDDKKRKSDAASDAKNASPAKVAKTAEQTDVKSEPVAVKKEADEKKPPPPADMTSEQLSILLEKEIRWILVNCPFEEMTTKSVRKQLEDRLHMDLRHHKASIKEGVARVIASMEEEDGGDSASTAPDESAATPTADVKSNVKVEANEAAVPVTPDAVVKKEAELAIDEEAARANELERTKTQLEAASKNLSLALDLEPKIMDVLNSLKAFDTVDKDVLAASTLQPRLVKLRAHRSSNIAELVSLLVKKWDVEDMVPAPKPITEEEILSHKQKLENSETSHDEMLVCLNLLDEMPLTMDHLKKTGLARAVSKLRQHGNDKVSAKAHDLRQKWIKQINADSDSGSDHLKTLKTLIRVLELQSDGADERKVQSKQLAALEQLHSMALNTRDIIESKVGISVSKLRKSSNDKISQLAKKLRKKWQAEAKAA